MTGFPIFGFFMMKYSLYSTALKSFEYNQDMMLEENNTKRQYIIDKLKTSQDIEDEALKTKLIEKQTRIFQRHQLLSEIIPQRDFD